MYWTKWLSSFGEKTKIPHRLFKRMNNLLHPRKKELVMPSSVKQVWFFIFKSILVCRYAASYACNTSSVKAKGQLVGVGFPFLSCGSWESEVLNMAASPFIPWAISCMYVCVPSVCLVPVEVRRGYQIPWNYSYNWIAMWVLGTEMEFSAKEVGAFSYWAISPAPNMEFNKGNYL